MGKNLEKTQALTLSADDNRPNRIMNLRGQSTNSVSYCRSGCRKAASVHSNIKSNSCLGDLSKNTIVTGTIKISDIK